MKRSDELSRDSVDPQLFSRLVEFRRDLHRHPELSWREERTADQICLRLQELGIRHRRMGGTGVVADLGGVGGGLRVALRADTDALPIQEESGLPFASVHDGVMHACGHDGHTAILLGAAHLLSRRDDLPVNVRLIFQPAEEVGGGARRLIEEGVLEDVDYIFGAHLDCLYPVGTVIVTDGAVNASTDAFFIRVQGKGGHSARPHEGVDAALVASHLVLALQSIVSREVNPAFPAVVTVGRFTAGNAANVMAGEALLEGTVRTLDSAVCKQVLEAIERMANSVAEAFGARVEVEFEPGTPPLINRGAALEIARSAATLAVGAENVKPIRYTNMGGEDFACYLQHAEGCFLRLGAQPAGGESYPAHSSRFTFNEEVLRVGAEFFYRLALTCA